jgi:hypothetical protein
MERDLNGTPAIENKKWKGEKRKEAKGTNAFRSVAK